MGKSLQCSSASLAGAVVAMALVLVTGLGARAGSQQPEALHALLSGQLLVDPSVIGQDDLVPPPLGRGGRVTGFAFAPVRPDLAYCALETKGERLISVLRIAPMATLWFPATREQKPVFRDERGRAHSFAERIPLEHRERELLSVGLDPTLPDPPVAMVGPIWWSPDGTRLAVCATMDDPTAPKQRDLWIVDGTTGKRVEVTHGAAVTGAAWSPDGKRLAVATARPTDSAPLARPAKLNSSGVWIVDTRTGDAMRIAKSGGCPMWSPDGATLVFTAADGPRAVEYDLEAKAFRHAKTRAAAAPDWAISRDGRYVAAMATGGGRRLEIRGRSTGALKIALSDATRFGCWSPDGSLLLFLDGKGTLQMTALTGPHAGRRVRVPCGLPEGQERQASVCWSARLPLTALPIAAAEIKDEISRAECAKQSVSWAAYVSQGQLRTTAIVFRLPDPGEAGQHSMLTSIEQERAVALSNMKQIALAMLMFANDHGMLPEPGGNVDQALMPYVKNDQVFTRPGRPRERPLQYLPSRALSMRELASPAEIPIAIFSTDYRGGVIVGYADGHVKWCQRDSLPAMIQKLREAESR